MSKKLIPSYTQWSTYHTCPHQYYRVYQAEGDEKIEKQTSEALTKGIRIHEGIENFLNRQSDELPEEVHESWLPYMQDLRDDPAIEVEKFVRTSLGLGKIDVYKQGEFLLDWKGLAVETPIPTHEGWSSMGDIQVGDKVFDSQGSICTVVGKSEEKNLPCYKVTFDDTSEVVCDEGHLWPTEGRGTIPVTELTVKDTISTQGPLQLPEVELPIHPYVLGIWLADGKHSSGELCNPDAGVWDNIKRFGFTIGEDISGKDSERCIARTVYGLRTKLRENNLLYNSKRIPEVYLRASINQRLLLLQGIYDGDGSFNKVRGQAILSSVNQEFSLQVLELAVSLGQRANISCADSFGFGKWVKDYRVVFTPRLFNPFLLTRKAAGVDAWDYSKARHNRRKVTKIENIASVTTQCIAVDSPDNTYLCTDRMMVTHNSGKARINDPGVREQLRWYVALLKEDLEASLLWVEHPFEKAKVTIKLKYTDILNTVWRKRIEKMQTDTTHEKTKSWKCNYCPVEPCEFYKNWK